jgi:hypothetical protein
MQRHRDIAGAPARSATEVFGVLAGLVGQTLIRSPHISATEIATTLDAIKPACIMLIAAGHLEHKPIVLVAGKLHLSIFIVSGDKALSVEENLDVVPGAADTDDWILHIPTPEPVGDAIATLIRGVPHTSIEAAEPDSSSTESARTGASSALNLAALAERMGNQ